MVALERSQHRVNINTNLARNGICVCAHIMYSINHGHIYVGGFMKKKLPL